MSSIYVMEAANIFCQEPEGIGPGESNHLAISEVKLPTLEEDYVDHTAGGSMFGIEIPTVIRRMEATFILVGWNAEVMKLIGLMTQTPKNFVILGVIRDRMNGNAIQARAVIQGRLGRVNPTNFRHAEFHHEYSIRSITSYQLMILEGAVQNWIYNFDYWTSTKMVGEIDANADLNRLLGINNAGTAGGVAGGIGTIA